MSDLRNIFIKLSELFKDYNCKWVQIAELYDKEYEASKSETYSDGNIVERPLTNLPIVLCALEDRQTHLDAMMELCTTIRALCDSERSTSFEMNDSWKEISEDLPFESYLAYVYAMAGLANLNPLSASHTKLSMAAVSTYFLSLAIPNAKGFHIFDEEIIAHCLQVFGLTERMQNPDIMRRMSNHHSVDIWVHLSTLCDDLKILLRYVHFKNYKNVRNSMIKKLINVLHLNHERGYANAYAANLHTKCFEIFEELINAHNGEPEETLTTLMNMTAFLHTYAKPKAAASMQTSSTNCEHISDWFISCISKYPRVLVKVINQFIEFMIVNPVKTWKTEQIQRALEYSAKYDAALFTKCNQSCVELLCSCIYAEEIMIRSRSIELIARILQLESKVDWQMFRDEVSDIPREVHLIKELIDSLRDNNNTIKLRAVQALQSALTKGSPNTQKIFTECVRFATFSTTDVVLPLEPPLRKNEVRYEKPTLPDINYTFQGHGILELSFSNLPEIIFEHVFQSSISNLRRAGISFMENLINLNPLIIFETKFVTRLLQFIKEPTALVRKQNLLTIDGLLTRFPCYPIIWIWCKTIAPMLNDADPKNTDLAISCFHSKVLLNITPLEQSNKAEHFIPWSIIRTMISTESRLYLQVCFNLALKQNLLNSKMLSIIESHLLTSNSLEAWIVLNFICGKIKSKEPDALIHMFISLPSWNKEPNMLIAIEVLANCVSHFSHTALNHAFNHMLKSIRDGDMLPVLIGKAIDFLTLIDRQSVMQSKNAANLKDSKNRKALIERPWINELEGQLEQSILQDITEFPNSRSYLISHLYSYSELNLRTRKHPNSLIVSFVHKYMNECLKIEERDLDLENERLFNSMIIIAGRLSLRDAFIAATTCNLYDRILYAMDHPPIVNTIIVAVTDICKKHTQTVENIIGRVLGKLSSPFAINRLETFKCFEKLVLQDQLKLRDTLLLSLLLALLDDNEELVMRATYFFTEFTTKKNGTLFHKCLTEYPFILNEYKNFVSKDSFSNEMIKSPLKGESQRKKRLTLYNYFMSEMDDISLILYFNQLKIIAEKCKTDSLIATSKGFEVIKDVFFILKRVCQLTKEKKATGENKADEGKDDDAAELEELNESANNTAPTTTNTAAAAAAGGGGGGGNVGRGRRRREVLTMEDALVVVEKSLVFMPFIFKHMISINELDISRCFDELCMTLAKRFHAYIVDAHHKEFWSKYLDINKTPTNVRRGQKRKSNVDENEESDDDLRADSEVKRLNAITEQSDTESESDDLPLILLQRNQQPSPSKKMRSQRHETLMEYVFNPNI